jgi:ubiquinone/menaquinone biosynthesis C-methylase UbiE
MAQQPIIFNDGEAYERGMGGWSQLAGQIFLDWLAMPAGLRWIDIGCGNGAFTELVVGCYAPAEIQGIDPSDGQLAFARTRPGARGAMFQKGNALALPFEAGHFDAAVMALVIFFVPEPAKGVAEMARVARPGGTIAAYAWDMPGGGFPFEPVQAEMRAMGIETAGPPQPDASRLTEMHRLWENAGLEAVETRDIPLRRTFASFDAYWDSSTNGASMRPILDAMAKGDIDRLKARVRARLGADGAGPATCPARANAIKGRKPKAS